MIAVSTIAKQQDHSIHIFKNSLIRAAALSNGAFYHSE